MKITAFLNHATSSTSSGYKVVSLNPPENPHK